MKATEMPKVPDKYRRTPEYYLVLGELLTAARYKGTVTYQEIAQTMGLPVTGNHMQKEVGHILGEIVEDETSEGRPMLSAVAVKVSGKPGDGFFGLAGKLGRLKADAPDEDRMAFWEKEKDTVYQTWQRRIHK